MAYNFDDETLKYYTQKLKEKLAEKDEIPTKTSDLTNDNGFITIDEVPKTDLTDYQTKSDATLTTTNKTVVGAINELEADSHTHTNKDVLDAITSEKITSWNNKAEVSNIPTKTSDLTNDSGFLTSIPSEYITETELDNKGYLTEHQDISGKADKLYVDTELTKKSDKTHTHDQYLTEHQDISGKANKSEIPTKTSQLQNDSGYLTSIPSEYVTETELESKGYLTEHQDISGKADKSYVNTELAKKSDKTHTHSYNDLSDKPVIPSIDGLATKKELTDGLTTKSNTNHTHDQYLTEHQDLSDYALKTELPSVPTKTSQLTNDSGFITSIPNEYITETELNAKGYLTEHQDISGKANISDLSTVATSGSYNDLTNKPTIPSVTDVNNAIKYQGIVQPSGDVNNCTTTGFYKIQQGARNLPINEYSFLMVYNEPGQNTLIQVWYSATSDKQRVRRRANLTWGDWYTVYTENEPPTIPSNISEFTNDVGYLTEIPSEYVTDTELNAKGYLTSIPSEYITETELNAKGYLTSVPSEYVTESELNAKGYLTEHQDISGKVDKINGKGLSTNDYTTEEKNKLNGIEENANNYSLPIASSTVLGGIKIGSGLSIDSNGVLSSNGGGSSDLSNYQTKTDNNLTTTDKTIVGAINELDIEGIKAEDYNNDPVVVGNNLVARVSALETNESEVLSRVDSLETNKADVSTVSALEASKADVSRVSALETNKADKSSIPTSLPANGGNSNTVGGFSIWVGTQSEYDAITTKSSTTLYFIREV